MIQLRRVLSMSLPTFKPTFGVNMNLIQKSTRDLISMLGLAQESSQSLSQLSDIQVKSISQIQQKEMNDLKPQTIRPTLPKLSRTLGPTQKLLLPFSLSQQIQYSVISTKEFHEQKKNLTKVKAFIKEFVLLMKEGTKDTWRDGKWYFNLLKRKQRSQMTGYEVRQSLRIRSDLFKIIPFSFFMIVPMAELLLPFYLLLFPNAMPSQYTFDYTYDQYIQKLEDNQAEAHESLVSLLKQHLMENCNASVDHFLHSDTYKQVFFKNFRNFEDAEKGLDFTKMSSDDLITVSRFLGMEIITGTFIVSKLLNIAINTPIWLANLGKHVMKKEKFEYSKFQLKLNFGPFEIVKRNLILSQIKRHLSLLRLQDQAFFKMGFHDIVGYRITDFARERGITTITCYETLKAILANEWVNVCVNRKFNDNAMLWYAIMQYDFLRNANNDMN